MSVILEALRKLDREKSSRRDGRANIAAEILRPDLPHPRKRLPLYFVIITLTAVATAAITYAVVELGFLTKSSSPPMKAPVTSQQVIPPPPDSPSLSKSSLSSPVNPPAAGQQATPAALSHELAHHIREEREPVPPKIESRIESQSPVTPLREKEASQKVPLEKADVGPANTIKPTEQTSNEPPTAPPPLKLSAIVWYEEPSRRFAMVNGMIIYEGAVIEGVKVEEIHPNHVRFSHSGRFFEISLIK